MKLTKDQQDIVLDALAVYVEYLTNQFKTTSSEESRQIIIQCKEQARILYVQLKKEQRT